MPKFDYRKHVYRVNALRDPTRCSWCADGRVTPGFKSCARCRARNTRQTREAQRKRWYRFLEMYGRVCACCGEADARFLTMDHVQNDGRQRKGRNGGNNSEICRALKAYRPDIWRVLCWNCNCGRHRNGGVCPHKDTKGASDEDHSPSR